MTFEAWLQSRLTAHGFKVAADGVIGGETKAALKAFQKAKRLPVSGVADEATVAALKREPGGKVTVEAPAEMMPPWMAEMHRRMGLHEKRDNALLSAWLKIGRFLGNPAALPWCGDAIETCVVKTLPDAVVPNNPFFAQAWKDFGIDAGGPKVGAIGVIRWSPKAGHVGIVAGYDAKRQRVLLLGGNQSDSVNLTWFQLSKFIAFRWPEVYPVRAYPPLGGDAYSAGSQAGTR